MLKPREMPATFFEAVHCALHDNCFILAKAAAYSAALSLFPGLIFATALLFRNNASETLADISISIGQVLPPSVHQLLADYLNISAERSTFLLTIAGFASILFASDLMAILMEGFRLAYQAPRRSSAWVDYGIAIALVFLSILPLGVANFSLILSRQLEVWARANLGGAAWLIPSSQIRWWVIALLTFTAVLSLIYYVAPNRRQRWRNVFPGAILAAVLWLTATALFTFYVQFIARYREFYGNIWTVIVLIIWTYLVSVIVMLGCQYNAARERRLGLLGPRASEHH